MNGSLRDDVRAGFTWYPGDWLSAEDLRSVSFAAKGLWIGMLCLMARSAKRGKLLDHVGANADSKWIANQLGGTVEEIDALVAELEAARVFSRDDGGIICRKMWRPTDLSEKRAEAGRLGAEAKRQQKEDSKRQQNSATAGTDRKGKESLPKEVSVVVDAWNELGRPFAKVLRVGSRRLHLQRRLDDPWWIEHWREAMAKMKDIPFCRGENDRGWVADMDFFLRPDTVTKILEGKYQQEPKESKYISPEEADAMDAARRAGTP